MEVRRDKLKFFRTGAAFRRWLEKNHAKADELWLGMYRKDSRKGGITYSEALDEALCYGWIDGIRKKLDLESFATRFTPRRAGSIWSNVNIAHVERLKKQGRMHERGLAAYEAKEASRIGVYSFEREVAELEPHMKKIFSREVAAWEYFQAQPPYYRRIASFWVISAKRDETRQRRLTQLIEHSANRSRLPQFTSAQGSAKKK
jgi:uncharacterized protein YdeI (YjbR/CyaY-like superfamily)